MANVPYNSNPTVEPSSGGSGATYGNVPEASPAAFGAQIGQAEEKLGATSEDLGKMYMQRANEASANDKIVNQWAPTATQLSQDYYSKQGKDAVAGFQPYIDGLQKARGQMLDGATPQEAQILNQYMTRHIAQEYDGAMRHQVQQMDVYENQMSDAFVGQQTTNAVNAGANPDMIDTAIKSGTARIQVHGLDRGQSPDVIQQQQNDFVGKTTQAVISAAVNRGDLSFANNYYANYKDTIPGAQQVEIDKTLHAENMRTFGDQAATSIINGSPLPHPPNGGADTTNVKSTVAGTAQSAGVDPNSSLMIAGIESSFGQNVGARGDVGQTGKPAANVAEQAKNLVEAQKTAQSAADTAVGGKAAPWQMYTVYQQGVGGGVALLKPENADKKAVDVVSQFYSNPKDALSAIQNNGGNATMTASQFTDMLKQKCDTVYGQVKCDTQTPTGQPIDLSKAIVDPHQTSGTTLQPAATPVKALQQFDAQYPQMLQTASAIPNIDQRNATLESLENKHKVFQAASTAWKTQFSGQIQQIVTDPSFTSMNDPRLTPELRSAMSDDPAMLTMARNMAKSNFDESQGKDVGKLGTAYWDTFKKINSGEITNISQLNDLAGNGLSRDGLTQAQKDLKEKQTPDGTAESEMKKQFFTNAKSQISGADEGLHIKDPKGDELFLKFMAQALPAYDKGKSDGKSPYQLLDPNSPDYIGKSVATFKRPMSQWVGDMMQEPGSDGVDTSTKENLIAAVQSGKMKRSDAEQVALKNGWIQATPPVSPQVPLAQ